MTNTTELENLHNSEHEASAELRTGEQTVSKSLDDIDIVETRVTTALGVERGTPEAVKLTDEALVGIANYELSSDDFTAAERRDAVEDIVVESAVELAHGATPDQTALSMFTVTKHPGEISEIVDRLNETHATLPSGHEAALLVIGAISELSNHPVMQEASGSVEYVPYAEISVEKETSIDAAVERAERAAELGIERSDFQGPEVRKAIKSYYADHEVALTVIEAMIKGTLSEADKTKLFAAKQAGDDSRDSIFGEALKTSTRLYEKGDIEGRNALLAATLDDIYREPCIGQQTLDEAGVAELAKRKSDIDDVLQPYRLGDKEDSIQAEVFSIRAAQEEARNETRNAGQLLFHNTLYGRDVLTNNSLRGRHQQQATQEKVNITTGDVEGHSALVHWSELYDPVGYKNVMQNNKNAEAMAMTIAVPLGEMVKKAPYGRELEYGNVEAKAGRSVDASRIGHEGEKVIGEIGAGAPDTLGKTPSSVDRGFWADRENRQKAAGYDTVIGGMDIMKEDPKTGIETPTVYVIQSDSDRLRNYNVASRKSDSEKIAEWRKDTEELSQRDFLKKHGQSFNDAGSGIGYGIPNRVDIQDIHLSTDTPAAQWLRGGADVALGGSDRGASFEQQAAQAEPYIRAMQKESMDRFAGTYVVPLRAANMQFDSNDRDNTITNAYGDKLKLALARANYVG